MREQGESPEQDRRAVQELNPVSSNNSSAEKPPASSEQPNAELVEAVQDRFTDTSSGVRRVEAAEVASHQAVAEKISAEKKAALAAASEVIASTLSNATPSAASDSHGRVTKAEIVQIVYEKIGGFSKKEAADLVELIFETMKETLGRGEKIKISGFGNFVLRDKRQRQGRNPQTGDPIQITARRVLSFKASQLLKAALNGGHDDGHDDDDDDHDDDD